MRPQRHRHRGGLDVADPLGVRLELGADHLAVVVSATNSVPDRSPGIGVDLPTAPERLLRGDRLAHLGPANLRPGSQHRQEQIIHGGK